MLIIDQGTAFMSAFFNETCSDGNQLSKDHPLSHVIKRDGRAISHVFESRIDTLRQCGKHELVRGAPVLPNGVSSNTKHRNRIVPSSCYTGDDVTKQRKFKGQTDQGRLESQRKNGELASLKQAYKSASFASKTSYLTNRKHYDLRAKQRSFKVAEFVYVYNPAGKPGLFRKFHRIWTGPYQITGKISDLNYEIIGKNGKKQVVHINGLMPALGFYTQESKPRPQREHKTRRNSATSQTSEELTAIQISTLPVTVVAPQQDGASSNQPSPALDSASPVQLDRRVS